MHHLKKDHIYAKIPYLGLSDGELRQIAQASDVHTAVGLARIPDSDLRLFLPPPPTPQAVNNTSIPLQFWSILSMLPTSKDVNECIKYFTSSALWGRYILRNYQLKN